MCSSRTNCNQITLWKTCQSLTSLRMLILFNVGSEQVLQLIYSTFLLIAKCVRLCYSVVSFAIFFLNTKRFNAYFSWNIMKFLPKCFKLSRFIVLHLTRGLLVLHKTFPYLDKNFKNSLVQLHAELPYESCTSCHCVHVRISVDPVSVSNASGAICR